MSARTLFVTGTDTEIGKTYASVILIRELTSRGFSVVGMKPVASGCVLTPRGLRSDDAEKLMAAANVAAPYELVNPYAFEPAIAPHIAASEAGTEISLEEILSRHRRLCVRADWVVVEGVGGWMVPLGENSTVADLASAMDAGVILVVGVRLGCINHALLSVESVVNRGLELSGWIANVCEPGTDRLRENIDTLARLISSPRLGTIPFNAGDSTANGGELDLDALVINKTR